MRIIKVNTDILPYLRNQTVRNLRRVLLGMAVFAWPFISACSLNSASVPDITTSASAADKTESKVAITQKAITQEVPPPASALLSIKNIMVAALEVDSAASGSNITTEDSVRIEDEFQSAFRQASSLDFISYRSLIKQGDIRKVYNSDDMLKLAARSGFDSVLFLKVNSFQQRSGSAYGSNDLASFGLTCKIVNLQGQRIFWESAYNYSDSVKPLISFDEGKLVAPRFRSLNELISQAADKLAQEFADIRKKAFLRG